MDNESRKAARRRGKRRDEAARALLAAEQKVLAEGMVRTRDMGGSSSTQEMGAAVRAALQAQ